ncbi:MAG TPA: pilin [Patescibacteria group bacterium]|nr:pilin [Candidatus Saccharimonadales bacterium]HSX46823.1 pilin [Patescibacteria group bacterium]
MLTWMIMRFAQVKNCTPDQAKTDPSCQTTLPTISADGAHVQQLLQLFLGIVAALTLIYIIIAAIRFVLSQGEPDKISKARNSIIFAAIGLAIILSAEIIVTFVLNSI